MKTKLLLLLGGLLFLSQAAMAQTNFTVSASVPLSSGITMTVSKVTVNSSGVVTSFVAQPQGTLNLPFGILTLNTALGIYADGPSTATYYWAIDLTPTNGAGVAQPTVSYVDTGTLPTGQTAGLGLRAGVQFAKVVIGASSVTNESPIPGQHYMLESLAAGVTVPYTLAAGGWMRMDIGLCTGNSSTDPSNCNPFTNADQPGTYQGTLTVSAAVN